MGLFSKRKSRSAASAWSTDKWKGLVSSVSKTSEMYCEKFSAAVASERASAAAHKAAGDVLRAKAAAELALRNRSKVRALARLATLADQLHMRELKIPALGSLQQLAEPARTEVVSFIYAAGRLSVQPLTEAVAMLRNIFPDDVDDIKRGKYAWPDFFDTRLYDALTPGPADDDLIENELLAATSDYPEYSANNNIHAGMGNLTSSSTTSPDNINVSASIPASIPPSSGMFHSSTPSNLQPVSKIVAPSLIIPPVNPAVTHSKSYTGSTMPTPSPPIVAIGAPPRAATLPPNHMLPRPWEENKVPPPAPGGWIQPSQAQPQQGAQGGNFIDPDYLSSFQDDDEALHQRYRDLRTS